MDRFRFRTLFEELLYDPESSFAVLKRRQPEALALISQLARLGSPEAVQWKMERNETDYQVSFDEIWELYAVSRVSDLLLLAFQEGNFSRVLPITWRPTIIAEQRTEFWLSLNMQPITQTTFSPFYHEIVEVVQAENPAQPITLLEELWPGFMLGCMLFCRAGVKVAAGTDHAIKDIAEHSTMYFNYTRAYRPCEDLSRGWGSNSQWRTDFRRDYAVEGAYFYNVDGKWNVMERAPKTGPGRNTEPTRNEFSAEERLELLTHRCFVRTAKFHGDLWPYYDYYVDTSNKV